MMSLLVLVAVLCRDSSTGIRRGRVRQTSPQP